MRKFSIEERLKRVLGKLSKRDKIMYAAIMNKMQEILTCADVDHYKNLRVPMQRFKRVHIKSSFILIFKYNQNEHEIIFCDLGHHDTIYT